MIFYTSSSSAKRRFYGAIFLAIVVFLFLCIALNIILLNKKTSQAHFIDNAVSKARHMQLVLAGKPSPKVIFVGSSKTYDEIDTAWLKDHDVSAYNYGVSGHYIPDYPYMVEEALKQSPAIIVIAPEIQEFYQPMIKPNGVYVSNLMAYVETHQPGLFVAKALFNYFISINTFREYSAPIYTNLRALYQRVVASSQSETGESANTISQPILQSGKNTDCQVFQKDLVRGGAVLALKCTNGDGVLLGSMPYQLPKMETLTTPNPHVIALLRYMIDLAKAKGVKPVLLFPPSSQVRFVYNAQALSQTLGVPIMDFTNASFPHEDWALPDHLNEKGRQAYTRAVYPKLQEYLSR